jgi:hypothetical protein
MYYVRDFNMRSESAPPATALALSAVLSEPQATPRYVVQLCQSSTAMSPRSVPHLDLFDLYHLYCADARQNNGAPSQALRLGFFKEPGTPKAIARYVARYFDSPRVVLVDPPEIVRALDRKFVPLKDVSSARARAAG